MIIRVLALEPLRGFQAVLFLWINNKVVHLVRSAAAELMDGSLGIEPSVSGANPGSIHVKKLVILISVRVSLIIFIKNLFIKYFCVVAEEKFWKIF